MSGLTVVQYWALIKFFKDNNLTDYTELSSEELFNLTTLSCTNCGIEDISVFAPLVNLEHLDLSNNLIFRLTPLEGLVKLTTLKLNENRIRYIDSLATLVNLEHLEINRATKVDIHLMGEIDDNLINDVTPLGPLTKLKYIDVKNQPVTSFNLLRVPALTTTVKLEDKGAFRREFAKDVVVIL